MAVQCLAGHWFREHVGNFIFQTGPAHFTLASFQKVLDTQLGYFDISNLTEAAPTTKAGPGLSTHPHGYPKALAKVLPQRLQALRFASSARGGT